MEQKELKIDPELRDLLPPLTDEEYKQLEKNIVENGFDKNFPIMEWHGYIVDGHNRYDICKKHNITDYVIGTLAYETKEEVMEWMLDIQLGRRNLSPIQRIAIAEKYRSIYEKQARENQSKAGGDKKIAFADSSKAVDPENKIDVRAKLAETAGVSTDTYSKGKKILDSDNKEVKEKVLSGEMSINAGYNKIKETTKQKENINNEHTTTPLSSTQKETQKPKISEEVKQICEDLKTERSKEYLDSIWDYKIDIIECMNAGFDRFYDGFVSILEDMENRVTKRELDECITNAEDMVEKMLSAIEVAKKINLKTEDKKMKLKDLVRGTNTTDGKIAHKEVPIDKLDAMLNYQRDIDMKRVELISSDEYFDKNEVDEVKVSVRQDGSMKVCDGQHTIAILKMRGWKTVPCELRYGLTIEDENDWFTITNTKEKPQNRKRTLTSQINGTYKKNKEEQDFNNCIKALGFKLDIFGEEPGNDYKIKCPAKLLEVYKEYSSRNDVDSFVECMDLVKGCWNGNSKSLQWNFIRGMFDFYETYKGTFDNKRLITSIGKKTPFVIKEIADNDKYTKKPSLRYAKVYVNEYNSGLIKNKRLKMSLLED